MITPDQEATIGRLMKAMAVREGHMPVQFARKSNLGVNMDHSDIIEAIRNGHTTLREVNAATGRSCKSGVQRLKIRGIIGARRLVGTWQSYHIIGG